MKKSKNQIYSTHSIKAEICFAVLNYRSGVCPLCIIKLPGYGLTEYIKYDLRATVHMINL